MFSAGETYSLVGYGRGSRGNVAEGEIDLKWERFVSGHGFTRWTLGTL